MPLGGLYSIESLMPVAIEHVSTFSNALVHMSELRSALFDAMHGID